MNNFKAPKIGYIDSNGKFISLEIDSITNTPITSSISPDLGSKLTVKSYDNTHVSNNGYEYMNCTKEYVKGYIDNYIENTIIPLLEDNKPTPIIQPQYWDLIIIIRNTVIISYY